MSEFVMVRIGAGLLALGLLTLTGCTRTEDYLEVARAQQQAMREVADILRKVDSARDLAAARDDLEERLNRFEQIARKAREMPKPPPEVASRIDLDAWNRTVRELTTQIDRVKRLEGGSEFFRQFEGRSALFSHAD